MENILEIRAINADNRSEIVQLIGLLSRCLGDDFPVSGVYDPRFLRACISSRFVSLVAKIEGRIISHIAYTVKKNGRVKIVLAVLDPEFENLRSEVESAFGSILEMEYERKSWNDLALIPIDSASQLNSIPGVHIPSDLSRARLEAVLREPTRKVFQGIPHNNFV